ncbi:cation transporter, partial [Deinococcus sp. GbtcB9]|uniref:cation transporter n=1 Tax=Deinococcus sp. GbtcB9 TaxID=2824754 RepID=UPI0020C621C8
MASLLTDGVALYAGALESHINVAAAVAAYIALRVAARPADASHPYGHTMAVYFSAVARGALFVLAAAAIMRAALPVLV